MLVRSIHIVEFDANGFLENHILEIIYFSSMFSSFRSNSYKLLMLSCGYLGLLNYVFGLVVVAVEPFVMIEVDLLCSTIHATLEYTREVLPKFS